MHPITLEAAIIGAVIGARAMQLVSRPGRRPEAIGIVALGAAILLQMVTYGYLQHPGTERHIVTAIGFALLGAFGVLTVVAARRRRRERDTHS